MYQRLFVFVFKCYYGEFTQKLKIIKKTTDRLRRAYVLPLYNSMVLRFCFSLLSSTTSEAERTGLQKLTTKFYTRHITASQTADYMLYEDYELLLLFIPRR